MNILRTWRDWLGWERLSETRARHDELIKLITTNHNKLMATQKERFAAIEKDLDEGLGEVATEIASLREQIEAGNDAETEAILQRIEGKAVALKNIIPNAPSVEPPTA